MAAVLRSAARRRALLSLLVAAALVGTAIAEAPAASAGTGYRSTVLRLVNAVRERHDLREVRLKVSLSPAATRHSRRMIRDDHLFDPPNLQQILARYRWTHVGAAAVGCGGTLRRIHRAMLSSAVHRGILLNPDVRWIGIGVVRDAGRTSCGRGSFWVTEILFG
jgi:uncharacterized protein YkwD